MAAISNKAVRSSRTVSVAPKRAARARARRKTEEQVVVSGVELVEGDTDNVEYIQEALIAARLADRDQVANDSDPLVADSVVDDDPDGHEPALAEAEEAEAAEEVDEAEEADEAEQEPSAIDNDNEPTPRRDRPSSEPGNFLAKYFREMAALSVLAPEEEFVAAREIEQLEVFVWQAILSFPPIVEHMIKVIETCMENSVVDFRTVRRAAGEARLSGTKANEHKLARAARRCAERLQVLDIDKQYLDVVLAELGRIERDVPRRVVTGRLGFSIKSSGFTRYCKAVHSAATAAGEARNDFVRANLRLVVSIARRFNHGRMALADLIQEGNIGLMKAVERYDYRRGFRFSTYASWWIRHAISRALADKGREVRLPVHMIDAHHRLAKAKRELTAKLGRQATTEELSRATQIAPEKIEKMRTYLFDQSFSLDRPVNDEDGRHFIDFLKDPSCEEHSPADVMATQAITEEIHSLLLELKPIEADILRQRFGLDDDQELTLKQIGAKYNLSRERIRQLQEQALTKMRRALERKDML